MGVWNTQNDCIQRTGILSRLYETPGVTARVQHPDQFGRTASEATRTSLPKWLVGKPASLLLLLTRVVDSSHAGLVDTDTERSEPAKAVPRRAFLNALALHNRLTNTKQPIEPDSEPEPDQWELDSESEDGEQPLAEDEDIGNGQDSDRDLDPIDDWEDVQSDDCN